MSSESALNDLLGNLAMKAQESQQRSLEKCFTANSENPTGFTNCLTKDAERFGEIEKQISGILLFTQLSAQKAQADGRDTEFIKQSSYKLIESKLAELTRNFE